MGDRGNIKMTQQGETADLYFYTHYSGSNLGAILKSALVRGRSRWEDEMYLARIIFCEMVKGDEQGLTGAGIGVAQGDGAVEFTVDVASQTVRDSGDNEQSFTEFTT